MSSDVAIRVTNLSKCYEIYDTPSDRLKQFIMPRFWRILGGSHKQYFNEFWALKDVSFEVKKGETVGIIGRNGSGKSTLLQMICGTLNPTSGDIQTNGRIAALLELGSGFNPEFTGRENVYMNAAVLGLRAEEVDERYNDIVAFADIGDFVEQPVKTYSSGMMVRLAFAVIAHVDADILVIDEALAVGDAVFTQKCMRFLRKFMEKGTILFVSHDTSAVQNLCKSAIWLTQGKIQKIASSKSVAEAYLQYTLQEVYGDEHQLATVSPESTELVTAEEEAIQSCSTKKPEAKVLERGGLASATGWKTGAAEITRMTLEHLSPGLDGVFEGGEKVRLVIEARVHQDLLSPILGFLVKDRLGQDLFGENTLSFTTSTPISAKAGQSLKAQFDFYLPLLPNGRYVVTGAVADGDLYNHTQHHYLHDALIINIASDEQRWGLVGIPFEDIYLSKYE